MIFPNQKIQEINDFYQIKKCFLYQNLTDTDSTSLLFNFICKLGSNTPESKSREIIFKCLKNSKSVERLDVSDEFWKQFDMFELSTKKMGLYETKGVDNPNICTIAINPK